MITIAFGSVPKDGGTFTFYRNIRPALLKSGIDIRCVAIGRQQAELWETPFADEGCVLLAPNTGNIKKQAQIFVEWCKKEHINIVMAINSVAILSALPHLPKQIRVVARCANAFDHGYRITMSGRERLTAIVALTPRLKKDLLEKYGADPQMLHLIPNGINPALFESAAKKVRGTYPLLRLGFLGRLEHNQKGVLHIPKIVSYLNEAKIPFHLQIAGKGKHEERLRQQLYPFLEAGQIEMLGALPPDSVPGFFENIDIYLFPSHFEGCPNALLEALMAGCVCLSWNIKGITDFVLEEGEVGWIFQKGDYQGFAKTIDRLHKDRKLLQKKSNAAAEAARLRFTPEIAATAYARVFHSVMESPPPPFEPLPWSKFKIDENFRKGWGQYIPHQVKSWVKKFWS